MLLVEAVGIRINKLLDERNITVYKLAKDGGFPRQTIGKIMCAKTKTISLNTIFQVTETLGITLQEFFNDPIFQDVTE